MEKWPEKYTSNELKDMLLKDMDMLETMEWIPDQDSIEAHRDVVKELFNRKEKENGV